MDYLSPPPYPAAIVVYKDVGGLVSDYEARTAQYRAENREVRLHECRSACTLALSLPNVCVYPDAKVKFHQAYNANTREVDLDVSSRLFASYPAAVQARLGYLTRDYRVLSGTELIGLGLRNCNGGGRVMIAGSDQPRRKPWAAVERRSAAASTIASANPLDAVASQILATLSGGAETYGRNIAPANVQSAPERDVGKSAGLSAPTPSVVPLPPRRPPADAFAAGTGTGLAMRTEFSANLALMSGARPILESARFTRSGCEGSPSLPGANCEK